MVYSEDILFQELIEIIEKENLFFMNETKAFHPVSHETLYRHFPVGSEKLELLKRALEKNRINAKKKIQKKWHESESATAQIMLYKLLGTEEERRRLSGVVKEEQKKSENFSVQLTDSVAGNIE